MVNDVSWSTVILILSLMLMHMLTLTVLMYKDGISRYCDGVSTEALQIELQRRSAAKRHVSPGMHRSYPTLSRENVPQLTAPDHFRPDFQPMYDISSVPVTPCSQWQEPIHSLYGRELQPSEVGVGESQMYTNPYQVAASSPVGGSAGGMSCKNNNSFFF